MIIERAARVLLVAAIWALPSAAFSQDGGSRQRIEGGKDRNSVRSALERFRKVGSGTKGTDLKPTTRPQAEVLGRLIKGGQGAVFIEREVDARTASLLERMGYRTVQSEAEISDKTLIGNKVYLLYEMDKDAFAPKAAELLKGGAVKLEVRHDRKGTPLVTAIRKAER